MDFPFYDQYQAYSTIELLEILKNPEQYQPRAVEAAARVLQEREVSPTELEAADAHFYKLEEKERARTEKINAYKEKAADILEPITHPGPEVKPQKWLTLFICVFGIEYAWLFYQFIKLQVRFLQCNYCVWGGTIFFGFVNLIYTSLIFWLVLKKRRWGWILLFADSAISVLLRLSDVYMSRKSPYAWHWDIGRLMLPLFINTAFVIFLWRRDISTLFGVTEIIRKRTIWVLGIFALLFIGFNLVFMPR